MANTTTIAVFGATGNQGGAVVKSLASSPHLASKIKIQAITRDPASSKSQALTKLNGGEVIEPTKLNLDDVTCEGGSNPLKGVDIVFANTNTFEGGPEKEIARGKALIDAAKDANVGLFVWSTLPSASEMSNGKYAKVEHFEAKSKVTEYLKASGLKFTALSLGWFADNIPTFQMVQKDGEGFKVNYSVLKEDTKVGWTWVAKDLGPIATAVIEAYVSGSSANVFNRVIPAPGFQASMGDLIAALEKETGLKGAYNELPPFNNVDLDDMHRLYNDFGLYKGETLPDPELVKLGVKFSTMSDIVKELALPALK